MTLTEERRLSSGDPSDLHLKKELSQIRKAARGVLKDPGTSASWRSLSKNRQIDGGDIASTSQQFLQFPLRIHGKDRNSNGIAAVLDQNSPKSKENEKRVFLHNWRDKKSDDEKANGKKSKDDEEYSSTGEEVSPNHVDSPSSVSNSVAGHHSKGDGCLTNTVFKCQNANLATSIRHSIMKKPDRSGGSSASSRHHREKLKMLLSMYAKNVAGGSAASSVGRDDLFSLAFHDSDDCADSDDLESTTAILRLKAMLRNGKVGDPMTPALSTSLYSRYSTRNPSTVGSWDAATNASFNADAYTDDEVDGGLDLTSQLGCGIPCYWSRRSTPRSRTGSCCSSCISDTLRNNMLCGSQASYQRRHRKSMAADGQSLAPLLKRSGNGPRSSVQGGILSDYEPLENYEEHELEGLSRLDRKMWSLNDKSREGLGRLALNGEVNYKGSPEITTCLSHKHKLMFFDELIGQSIVVKALTGAVFNGNVSPLYIFHGPRGVGKTSAARIFAAASNCLAFEKTNKPCGVCMECAVFLSGKSRHLVEIDGSNDKRGIEKVKNILEKISAMYLSRTIAQHMFFVVKQCHLLPKKAWLTFLGLLEKPLFPFVVFILITTDIHSVPPAVLSRCQKHSFNKIGNGDIVARLMKLSSDEGLDVESSALELIASNVDGSLRDAETILDQLSLFGKRITKSLVNELIGSVSDEKLLELLQLAMSSNATETVLKARELMDSGVDPIVLVSQLVTLIVDLIAGTYQTADAKNNTNSFVDGMSLSGGVERLRHALTVLSEAEHRLRMSGERSTWFTATLLQLGSLPTPSRKSKSTCSSRTTDGDHKANTPQRWLTNKEKTASLSNEAQYEGRRSMCRETEVVNTPERWLTSKEKTASLSNEAQYEGRRSMCRETEVVLSDIWSRRWLNEGRRSMCRETEVVLSDIWFKCIDKCHSKTLRQLLGSYGKLISLSKSEGGFVAFVSFADSNMKTRAEGFLSSLTNSFETVLQSKVEVKLILLQEDFTLNGNRDVDSHQGSPKLSRTSFNVYKDHFIQLVAGISSSPNSFVPPGRIDSITDEQRLETAWLEAMERSIAGATLFRPERNQVLPQNPSELGSDELSHEIEALKIGGDQRVSGPISPSVLHASKHTMGGYESESGGGGGGGCGGIFFCWNSDNSRPRRREKEKAQPAIPRRHARKNGQLCWLGECAKSRRSRDV